MTNPQESENASVDELLDTFRDSKVLELLGITNLEVLLASDDSDLLETVRITHAVLNELEAQGVLDTFLCLPDPDQANFMRWIGATDDSQIRAGHTATFVSALKEAPLPTSNERKETS